MSDGGDVVVLVGHCGPDEWMLRSAIQRALPEAEIEVVHDDAGMQAHRTSGRLLLVNRVLDGGFANTSGLDLLAEAVEGGASRECARASARGARLVPRTVPRLRRRVAVAAWGGGEVFRFLVFTTAQST